MIIRVLSFVWIVSSVIVVLASSLSHAQNSDPLGDIYKIRVGDMLQVSVHEDPTFNRTMLVRPDGRISLPLVGTVVAAGQTPEALQRTIQEGLRPSFIVEPTVTVSLSQIAPAEAQLDAVKEISEIFIIGTVKAPGRYQVVLPVSALQALALAGGPDIFAAKGRIHIRRRSGDTEEVLPFDYNAIENGERGAKDIQLQDGDIIVVPERGLFN